MPRPRELERVYETLPTCPECGAGGVRSAGSRRPMHPYAEDDRRHEFERTCICAACGWRWRQVWILPGSVTR